MESSKDLTRAIATENVGNKLWRNGTIDERLFGKNGIVDKAVDIEYNKNEKYLQKRLDCVFNGEKIFIPKNTQFEKVKTIAGNGSQKAIRDVNRLVSLYGGNEKDWKKQSGKIKSEKYIFDIHWYEYDSNQYEVKLKYRSDSE